MRRRRDQRKDLQLCAQVRDAVELALMQSNALERVWVREVVPNPDTSNLLVIIECADPAGAPDHIGPLRGALRSEVASAIHRKRVPELSFQFMPISSEPD